MRTTATINVELVKLGQVDNIQVPSGITVSEFKYMNGLSNYIKILDSNGNLLKNEDTIMENCTLFMSAPKKNA